MRFEEAPKILFLASFFYGSMFDMNVRRQRSQAAMDLVRYLLFERVAEKCDSRRLKVNYGIR